ncbi:restriction modification system DNA specificity domain-containing protein [Nitrosomonas sp. Is79A3]|uniref:restriction endonuclease subunit S n=1 Tax=Nitrosomonas sp. (strain Is79A3) TaxID=261292 RepID=UPI000215CDBD
MIGVRIIHLGEIARFRYGKMPETEKILVDDATGGFPIFTGYRIAGRYSEFNIETPKLIVVCRGVGGTGDVKITPAKCWLTNLSIVFELVEEFADIHYLYYFFAAYSLRFLDTGSAQSQITITDLQRLKIPLPNLITQKKIAAILSAYDELIENNQRRIALLEKMAEEIYREWFVRMRFPDHEKVKKVKGVPEDWCVAELKELASINPSSINRQGNPESILYVDISSVSTNRIDDVTPYISANAPGRARRRVKHGDVIWSSVRPANRAYCLIYEPPENLIVSTGFAVIRPNSATPFTFLFFAVTSNPFVDQMTTVAKGAAYPATSFDDFEKAKLLVPTEDLLRAFHEKIEPMFRQRHFLQQQSERLRKTRDMLLPRLISGKLSVEHLDIQFPPGMEESAHAN